jgi:mannosyltransferase
MSLYYLLLRGWIAVFGDGEVAVRALSVAFAVATLPVLHALTARLRHAGVAFVAVVLLAVNPTFVRAAQDARAYSLVVLLSVAATYLAVRLADDDRASWIPPAYVVVGALSLYAHFYAAFVLAVHVVLAVVAGSSAARRRQLLASGAILVLAVPLLVFVATQDRGQVSHLVSPSVTDAIRAVRAVIGMGNVGLLAWGALAAAALVRSSAAGRKWRSRDVVLLALWLAVPPLAAYAISQSKPIFAARYLVVVLAPLAVLVAVGLAAIPRRLGVVATTAVVVLAMANLPYARSGYEYEDFRDATRYLAANAREGDGVVFYRPSRRIAVEHYLDELGVPSPSLTPVFPRAPWGEFDLVHDYEHVVPTSAEWAAIEAHAGTDRLWLFLSKPQNEGERRKRAVRAQLLAVVASQACHVSTKRFHGLEIQEFEPGARCAGRR